MMNKLFQMKEILINLICGLIIFIINWFIFYFDFLFGPLTLLVFIILFIVHYYYTSKFNLIITLLFFLIGLIVSNQFLEKFVPYYFDFELFDDQYFPTAQYFIIFSFIWVSFKFIVETIFNNFFHKYSKLSKIELLLLAKNKK